MQRKRPDFTSNAYQVWAPGFAPRSKVCACPSFANRSYGASVPVDIVALTFQDFLNTLHLSPAAISF